MQHMLHSLLAGQPIQGNDCISVTNPYDQTVIGNVTVAQADHTYLAIETALEQKETLTRYQRFEILDQSRRELRIERGVCPTHHLRGGSLHA